MVVRETCRTCRSLQKTFLIKDGNDHVTRLSHGLELHRLAVRLSQDSVFLPPQICRMYHHLSQRKTREQHFNKDEQTLLWALWATSRGSQPSKLDLHWT